MIEIERERAKTVAADAFSVHGITPSDAAIVADVLVSADARGKHSHGLIRLPRYIRGIKHDNVDPEGRIERKHDTAAVVTLCGGSRLGPVVASEAVGELVSRTDQYGIGAVGVHNSTHLGMLGYYTDIIRREGYVGIAVTNTEPAMPPYGGSEPILGTNPIAIGLPTDPPFNLDMSTSAIARGSIEAAAERGELLPEGVALDAEGNPTRDPDAALDGAILPFGGPKGSGLAIAIEVLAGGVVGASMGREVTGTYHTADQCTKGDLFMAIDPQALGGPKAVDRIESFLQRLTNTAPAGDHESVRLPSRTAVRGEHAETVTVEPAVWDQVVEIAGHR